VLLAVLLWRPVDKFHVLEQYRLYLSYHAYCFLISHLDAACLALLEICSWSLFLKNNLFASFTFHVYINSK
jgi:hypothetical protein